MTGVERKGTWREVEGSPGPCDPDDLFGGGGEQRDDAFHALKNQMVVADELAQSLGNWRDPVVSVVVASGGILLRFRPRSLSLTSGTH